MEIYFDEFTSEGWKGDSPGSTWARVQQEFETTYPEPDEVIFARYSQGGYEGDAVVVFRKGDEIGLVTGGHCSCHGLEGQFEPEFYPVETFEAMLEREYLPPAERVLIMERIRPAPSPPPLGDR